MRHRAEHLLTWAKSSEWRAISSTQAKKNLRALALRPRCGAHCRTTGQPCQNPVVSGRSRCRLHSGTVGRGDSWHKPVWPDRNSPNASTKLNRKLRDLQRAADKRAKRIARMGPDELASYRKWQREHEPTSAADRARRREQRRQDREARNSIQRVLNEAPRQKSAEAIELQEQIDALKAELAANEESDEGVFG